MNIKNYLQKYLKHGYCIVQGGYVAINDCAIYDVWSAEIEPDASEHTKLCLYDANNMLMASIDIDLIKDIEIIKMNEENEIIND